MTYLGNGLLIVIVQSVSWGLASEELHSAVTSPSKKLIISAFAVETTMKVHFAASHLSHFLTYCSITGKIKYCRQWTEKVICQIERVEIHICWGEIHILFSFVVDLLISFEIWLKWSKILVTDFCLSVYTHSAARYRQFTAGGRDLFKFSQLLFQWLALAQVQLLQLVHSPRRSPLALQQQSGNSPGDFF